ncbi:MAG TPA: hypothetical protein VGC86_08385 [Afipia sp.]
MSENDDLGPPNWSFDLAELRDHLDSKSDLEGTIRGHLYLEHVLIQFLQEAMPRHELLSMDRLPFNTKVEIGAALGVVPKVAIGPLKKINELRNRSAHNLHYVVSLQDKKDLLDLFDSKSRILVLERGEEGKTYGVADIPISHFIKVMVILVDLERQGYVRWKQKREEALKYAKEVLARVKAKEEDLEPVQRK